MLAGLHPWDTNYDIFDAFRELSDPSIDSKDPNTIKAQKRSKEMGKIIYVTSVVQLYNCNFTNLREYFLSQKTIIDTLHKEGKSQRIITEMGGCSRSAVSKHIKCKVDWKDEIG